MICFNVFVCIYHDINSTHYWTLKLFFFFWVRTGYTLILELISLLQNILVLSKVNKVPTIDGGSTETTKVKLLLVSIFANASAHQLASRYACSIYLLGIALSRFL